MAMYAVALSDTTLIVGAWEEDSSATGLDGNSLDNSATASGAASPFHHFLGMWQQLAYIKASNTDAGDDFGLSVGVGDGFAVIGAPNEDSTSSGIDGSQGNGGSGGNGRSGAAYVIDFSDLDNGSPTCSGDGTAGQCPCFNFGNLGAGCENSVSFGARLEGSCGCPLHGDRACPTLSLWAPSSLEGSGSWSPAMAPVPCPVYWVSMLGRNWEYVAASPVVIYALLGRAATDT